MQRHCSVTHFCSIIHCILRAPSDTLVMHEGPPDTPLQQLEEGPADVPVLR
jgi:hypothetical protein